MGNIGINQNVNYNYNSYNNVSNNPYANNSNNADVSAFENSAQFQADTQQLQQDKQEISALIQKAQSGDREAINELLSIEPQPFNTNNDSNAKLQNEVTQMLIQAQAMYENQAEEGGKLNFQA